MRGVDLYDVAGLEFEQLSAFEARVQPLAGGDGQAHGVGDLLQRAQVLRGDRLFQPCRLERRQFARHFDGGGGTEAAVHFYEDLEIGSDGVADGLHQRDGSQFLGALQLIEARSEGVQLRGLVAARHHPARGLGEILRVALHRVPPVRIGFDFVVAPAPPIRR